MTPSKFFKPTKLLAITASVSSACFYISYRNHDRRELSDGETEHAREIISQLTPPSSTAMSQQQMTAEHMSRLNKYGATVVRETLSPKQLIKWNITTKDAFGDANNNNIKWNSGRAHYCISKRSINYSDMARVGCRCNPDDESDGYDNNDKSPRKFGFFMRKQARSTPKENTTTHPSVSLQDIVQSYFDQHGIKRYQLTDIQFLNAYPDSTNQIWHRDNKFRGMTAIVALKDVRGNGPTELLIGSHQKDFTLWSILLNAWQTYRQNENKNSSLGTKSLSLSTVLSSRPLLGCIDAGDTLLYDATIFHRGRGYTNAHREEDRPVLVLRWDAARTPPPGAGLIVTTANKYVGCIYYAILFAIKKVTEVSDEDSQ